MARRRKWRPPRRRLRRRPLDDPGRRERRRWRRMASEVLAAFDGGEDKPRRLLISLAAFLEPRYFERLGAEGVWGVFRAFREIADRNTSTRKGTAHE